MAKVIYLASRRAAPSPKPIAGLSDPIALHTEAHNALSMARHYLTLDQANVVGATRKIVQALAALRRLDQLEG